MSQPENSIKGIIASDLTEYAFYDALEQLGVILPEIELTINPKSYFSTQATFNPKMVRVRILFNDEYKLDEWSIEINKRTYWSPGA